MAALTTAPASAQSALPSGITDPGEIDRVVAQFTGAAIGATGGARQPADRRLRLAPCSQPLFASWHGQAQTTVSVECPDPGGWRIFVATLSPQTPASQEQAERAVKRGDPITVVVRGRGFSVQQAGEALDNGAIGDWIGVRTSRRGEPVRARIERPGLAIIPAN
jgi:flagella basal body P-ring formation protein FlgA